MKNAYNEGEGMQLESSPVEEMPTCVHLERSMNMQNDLDDKLNIRGREAWAAFGSLREATDHLKVLELRAHLFDTTVFPTLLRS